MTDFGWTYHGGFSHGMFEGEGTYDGEFFEYVGGFKEGNVHGHGVMTCQDGTRYEGHFDNGKMSGQFKEKRPGGVERTGTVHGIIIDVIGLCRYY